MTVGERIKKRREELGLSQSELGKQMGVSRQAISKAELHESYITTDKVTKFSEALGVSIAYLMGWEEPNSSMGELLELNKGNESVQAIFDGIHAKETLDYDELKLIEAWRACDDEGKKRIMDLITYMIGKKS